MATSETVYVILAQHHHWAPEPGQGEGFASREEAEGAVAALVEGDPDATEGDYRIEERRRGWGRS